MKRLFALFLMVALLLCGCNRRSQEPQQAPEDYDTLSREIYDAALGEFLQAYNAAQQATSVSQRHALMAVAEAKLLASGVMLPLSASGGSFAISRLAPRTTPSVLWGSDADRFAGGLVTTKPITKADRAVMEEKWSVLKGTGEYLTWAEGYLKEKGYTLKDRYTVAYSSDPQTWDVLATAKATDMEAIVNTYDGLYQYDCEGTLQPALADSYEKTVLGDGRVEYAFNLKTGIQWVDSQGRAVAAVKADDFVAGLQHLMDVGTGPVYLVRDLIAGAEGYLSGEITDFSQVGVRAESDSRLVYTLTQDAPYFMTMLGYGVFAPLSREYYTSQGGKFGAEYDASADSYTYGRTPDNIAYCGPYLVTNNTAENTIVFSANPAYYNKKAVKVQTITWLFNDGKDVLKAYTDTTSGAIDGASLNSPAAAKAKSDGVFNDLAFAERNSATTQVVFHNLNRQSLYNFNDNTVAVSGKSAEQVARTTAAMGNVHFRRALCCAVDRAGYNAQSVGEDLKLVSLRNSYVPGDFITLTESVAVGGRLYPAGTAYGRILQDQLNADGVKITVYDGDSDGFDGWYNPAYAREELEKALQELDIEITNNAPILLDFPYFSGSEVNTNRAYAYKQSVENALGGLVRVELIPCSDRADVLYAGFYAGLGSEANYDVYDIAGWGPDYGDPQTYLYTLLPDYAGDMTRMLGIF